MNVRRLALMSLLGLALTTGAASAQEATSGSADSPFRGSVPQGTATAEPLALSLKEAVNRGLQYNLGLLLQEEAVETAHGERWDALADLLPHVNATVGRSRQVINLESFGFTLPDAPSIVGPFNVFDARVGLSQPIVDLRAMHDAHAASLKEHAAALGVRSARDLVVLVSVNLYLEAVAASSRIDVANAQQATAEALLAQANDLKASGLVAGIDVLRAEVQVQNQKQRAILARNGFEKAKLQLARAIGLPAAQALTLTDEIPYAPLAPVSLETALQDAYDNRADYLAARDRLAAAEAESRAATAERLPTLTLDADYGTIGQHASSAHPTYAVAATVHVPIFEGGRLEGRRIDTAAEVRRRRAELDDLKGRIDVDVRTALLDIDAAAQQLEAARTTQSLATEELEQARDRFAAGVASNIEVTEAQESVAAASETYISALYSHNLAKATLARAVGIAESAITSYLGGVQ